MTGVWRETGSGLAVAEQGWDFETARAAIRQIDGNLTVQFREGYWKVVHVPTGEPFWSWMTPHGEPLPLSSGLVEEFKRQRLDAPNKGPSVDEHNRRLRERLERDRQADSDAIVEEHHARVMRGRTTVSLADTRRKPEWLKKHRGRNLR